MDLLGGPLAVVVLVAIAIVLIGVLIWLYRRLGAALTGVVAAVVLVIAGGAFFLRGRAYEHQRFEGAIRPYLSQTGPWQEWAVSIEPVIRGRLLALARGCRSSAIMCVGCASAWRRPWSCSLY